MCILYKKAGQLWQKIGQTEMISDTLNPEFVQKITVDFHFEQSERFKVEVYDVDDEKNLNNLAGHDFIGLLEFSLHEIVTCRDQTLVKPIINPKITKPGKIKMIAEEIQATSNTELIKFVPEAQLKDMSG